MFSFFTSDLRRNLIKILCLTVGLSVGFIIIAKVYFEKTYDTFFPDSDRIYYVAETFTMNGEYREWAQTSGGIGEVVTKYVPQVEYAARQLPVTWGRTKIKTDDDVEIMAKNIVMVDSCFFDVFGIEVISGNPREILSHPNYCMIPESLAGYIGEDAVGKTFTIPDYGYSFGSRVLTIGGIYKDLPPNSTIRSGIMLSMETDPLIFGANRHNWRGNDRFHLFLKLNRGADVEETDRLLYEMLKDNVDAKELEQGYGLRIHPMEEFYTAFYGGVDSSINILAVLAVVMILSASLNYLLVVLGQIPRRSKEMAVRKCYGTSNFRIFVRAILEGLFYLVISILLAVLIVWCFPDLCRELLGSTAVDIFSAPGLWMVISCVVLLLLVVAGIIPGILYCRTPVARAFRVNVRSRRRWKLALLSVQFVASGMLLCILTLVGRQYAMMLSLDFGLDYKHLVRVWNFNPDQETVRKVIRTLEGMPGVEGVATLQTALLGGASGNNVSLEGVEGKELNVADMYATNPDLFDVAGIRFLQGTTFREKADSTVFEVVVDQKFAEDMERVFGWDSKDIVGKGFRITEHMEAYIPEFTVVGVVNNIRRGALEEDYADRRGTVYFPGNEIYRELYVKFAEINPETMQKASEMLNDVAPEAEIGIEPVETTVITKMSSVKNFGLAIGIVGISTFIITLIGLLGYTSDEVIRRSREIAVRRLTGTSTYGIVGLFCREVMTVAIPSLLAGGAAALVFGGKILSLYSDRVSLSPLSMLLCLVGVAAVIVLVVVLNTLGVARDNLSRHLRNE